MRKKIVVAIITLGALIGLNSDLVASEKVGALGHIRPSGGFINVGVPSGNCIMDILVKPGDVVKRGAPLVILQGINQDTSAFALAQLSVKEADELGKRAIELQRLRVKEADELGKRAIELKKLEIIKAKLDYDYSEGVLKRLVEGGSQTYSAQQKDDCEYKVKATRAQLDLAAQELDRLILDRKIKLDLATQELNRLIVNHEISVSRARLNLEAVGKKMKSSTLTAPVEGTILEVLQHVGETTGGRPIIRMANLQQMDVVAEVFQGDILKLSPGMKATITSTSLPTALTGTVVSISRIVSEKSRNVEVIIRLND
jgi:HlyD family secretion protein